MMVCTKVSWWEEGLTGIQRGMLIRVCPWEISTKASLKAWTPFACTWKEMEWMTSEDAWRQKGVNWALYRKGGRRGRRKWRTEKWRTQRGRWGTSIKSSPEGKEDISEGRSVLRDRATSFMIKRPLVGLSFLIKVSDLKLRIHDGKRVGRVVSRYKEKQSRDGLTSFSGGGGSVRRGK